MIKLRRKGFTLVEIMIVVAIIALLAAIAIPNLMRARLNANESAAIATCKTVVGAATSYASVSNGNFPTSLNSLTSPLPPYLDSTLDDTAGAPGRQGYTFTYDDQVNGALTTGFYVFASPQAAGTTGSRDFYIDESGVVYAAPPGNW